MSDTRTNAGVDNFSTFQKMFTWSEPGKRFITVMAAGNLATTQTVISLLDERTKAPEDRNPSIMKAPSIFQVAQIIGQTLRDVIQDSVAFGQEATSTFDATIILGGQIETSEPRLFLIYPEGNFIEASEDTSYFQMGETKYGRPILVRAFDPDMAFEDAIKLLIVSFDLTITGESVGRSASRRASLREGQFHFRPQSTDRSRRPLLPNDCKRLERSAKGGLPILAELQVLTDF